MLWLTWNYKASASDWKTDGVKFTFFIIKEPNDPGTSDAASEETPEKKARKESGAKSKSTGVKKEPGTVRFWICFLW